MEGAERERLLAVKRGQVFLAEVVAEAKSLMPALEAARDASPLEASDAARADALLRRIQEEVAPPPLRASALGPALAGLGSDIRCLAAKLA